MMNTRTNEGPMEFEYQSGHGPVPADSPFPTGQKRSFDSFASPKKESSLPFSSFASHINDPPTTPLTKPTQQFRGPAFAMLRSQPEIDFSSGPENMSSPENADNDLTPEMPSRLNALKGNGSMIDFAAKRSDKPLSSMGIFGNITSPTRGESPRRNHENRLVHKIHKRRRRDADRDVRQAFRRPSNDSDAEERSRPSSSENVTQQHSPAEVGFIPSIFSFIERHPNLPHILSFYAQLLLNVFLVFFFLYIIYSFWSTIRSDVDKKSEEVAAETLAEMAVCAREYVDNRCDRANRVPAMETVCNNWEKCMNKDPNMVGRARVSAHTFAEIFNSFIEPISYKAMIFCLTLVFGCVAISNFAFGFFRNKGHPPPHAAYMHVPPQQQMGFPGAEDPYHFTPYGNHAGMPRMASGEMDGFGMKTPVKRLGYR